MKKRENIQHKRCVQGIFNRTKASHSCLREHPVNVNGDWHYLDVLGVPNSPENKKLFKSFAIECETNMNTAQARSNKIDLLAWKEQQREDVEIAQITNESEFDINKLKKKPKNPFNSGGFRR